jgi:hypothetical protein
MVHCDLQKLKIVQKTPVTLRRPSGKKSRNFGKGKHLLERKNENQLGLCERKPENFFNMLDEFIPSTLPLPECRSEDEEVIASENSTGVESDMQSGFSTSISKRRRRVVPRTQPEMLLPFKSGIIVEVPPIFGVKTTITSCNFSSTTSRSSMVSTMQLVQGGMKSRVLQVKMFDVIVFN